MPRRCGSLSFAEICRSSMRVSLVSDQCINRKGRREKGEEREVEDEEVEEEEEESMEVIKIGKKKYYCGETSRQIFVYLNDEESGDCLGKYVDGKIVSLK